MALHCVWLLLFGTNFWSTTWVQLGRQETPSCYQSWTTCFLGRSVLHEKVASFFDPFCLFKPIQNLLVHKKFEDLYKRNDLQDTMPPEVLFLPMFSFINCVRFWASGNASTYAYVDMLIDDICIDFLLNQVYYLGHLFILPRALENVGIADLATRI